MYYVARGVISSLPISQDNEKDQQDQARLKAAAHLRKLQRSRDDSGESGSDDDSRGRKSRIRKEDIELNQYESQIAMEVVAPDDIPVGFDG